jgi:hypothetical protein
VSLVAHPDLPDQSNLCGCPATKSYMGRTHCTSNKTS